MTGGTISFDLDQTLISGPFGRVLTDVDDALTQAGREPVKPEILRRHHQLLSADPLAAYDWDAIVAEVLARTGQRRQFDLVDRLAVHVRNGGTRLLDEHTFQRLAALRAAGWLVLVLTNGLRRYQEPILRGAGLLEAIDRLVTADDVGQPKPNRAAFLTARGDAERYVHVGDRLDHDIAGGNAAGAETILLDVDLPVCGAVSDLSCSDAARLQAFLDQRSVEQQITDLDPPELLRPDYLAVDLSDIVGWLT